MSDPLWAWKVREEIPQDGYLDREGAIEYHFHGIGCLIRAPGLYIDFDYGMTLDPEDAGNVSGLRHDGFDAQRLLWFNRENDILDDFRDLDSIERELRLMESQGMIERSLSYLSDHLYFLKTNICEGRSISILDVQSRLAPFSGESRGKEENEK